MNKILFISAMLIMSACTNQPEPKSPTKEEIEASRAAEEKLEYKKNLGIATDPKTSNVEKIDAIRKITSQNPTLAKELEEKVMKDVDRLVKENEKKREAERKKQEHENAIALKEEKKRKRSQGVSIGMTMQDVLDSSWGKPQHKTTYNTSSGDHTIWQYGEYGERGAISFDNGIITMIQN